MKKLFIVFAALAFAATAQGAPARGGKGGGGGGKGDSGLMSVEVREAIVRATPNYMASAAGALRYGAEVNITGEDGNWYRIAAPSGWLPKSAVTSHRIEVDPDAKGSGRGGSHDEVALAGKGFNPQVEAQYKRENAAIAAAFAQVDRVEGFGATESELRAFRKSGKLSLR